SHITSDRKRAFFDLLAEITGSPGTPEVSLQWSREPGSVRVQIEGKHRGNPTIERVELLINNEVVTSTVEEPYAFQIDAVPEGEHWVRARARYRGERGEVIIESPY